jgi:3-oxoacyl-[acyl-carrier-protein] synthase-3
MGSAITGLGAALPDKVVTNDDLAARLDTSDEWIVERTGIRERRVGGSTSELAIEAGRKALQSAGCDPGEIGLLVLATTTPDQLVPATSARVQHSLGLGGGAFDVNAACSGFVYSLLVANAMITAGQGNGTGNGNGATAGTGPGASPRKVLVVGADTLSPITDPDDRGTVVLFADGAGAAVVEQVEDHELILGTDIGVDGSQVGILYCDHGGFISMEGREVYRRAVRATVDSAKRAMERAGVTSSDIALFVPHQANLRIVEAVNERIGMDLAKCALCLDRTGNTSSGSIPMALTEAVEAGRIGEGDLVLLSGFGAGMTWASAVIRWGRGAKRGS